MEDDAETDRQVPAKTEKPQDDHTAHGPSIFQQLKEAFLTEWQENQYREAYEVLFRAITTGPLADPNASTTTREESATLTIEAFDEIRQRFRHYPTPIVGITVRPKLTHRFEKMARESATAALDEARSWAALSLDVPIYPVSTQVQNWIVWRDRDALVAYLKEHESATPLSQ